MHTNKRSYARNAVANLLTISYLFLQVKVLYVRNLTVSVTEESLREKFESFGKVERVKKIKDYAFVHFEDREQATEGRQDAKEFAYRCMAQSINLPRTLDALPKFK